MLDQTQQSASDVLRASEQWVAAFGGPATGSPSAQSIKAIVGALAEMLTDAFWVRTADRQVLYVNSAFERIWGRPREDFYRDFGTILEAIHPDDRPAIAAMVAQGGQEVVFPDTRIIRPDGAIRWVRVKTTTRLDESGVPVVTLGTAEDITDRRQAREELGRAIEQAQRANREKDHFLAMLSHELRTPLTPVLAAISAMEQDENAPEPMRRELVMVHRNIDLESRLIDDLLDLTRISRGKLRLEPRVVDAEELISRAIAISSPDIDAKHIQVIRSPGAPHVRIVADPARIQQVFWNIIKNAVQYTDKGGRISIETGSQAGSFVARVTDNGMGIDPAFLPRIFEAFEQEHHPGRYGSLGLGLAISRTVVDLHGGSITAESEGHNCGSRFTVTLPLAEVDEPKEKARPLAPLPAERPALRVLLVEDHPSTVDVLSRVLKRMGHQVQTAMTLADAARIGGQQTFDLLISDIGLPDGSGLDLLAKMRASPKLRAIALSGYGMDQDITNSRIAGFHAHLTKPVDLQMLTETIQDVINQ